MLPINQSQSTQPSLASYFPHIDSSSSNKRARPDSMHEAYDAEMQSVTQTSIGLVSIPVSGSNHQVEVHYHGTGLDLKLLETLIRHQNFALQPNTAPLANLGESIETMRKNYLSALQVDETIRDALSLYVGPEGKAVGSGESGERFDLRHKLNAFLESDKKVFLLLGEAGSGKSTFNRSLARDLWGKYEQANEKEDERIPVFISLTTLDDPNKNLLTEYFTEEGFSKEQIQRLRQKRRFTFILDGYDEIKHRQRAFYTDNKLEKWDAKVIISSRPEYLGPNYQSKFYPSGQAKVFEECELAPFSKAAIKGYVESHARHAQDPKWNADQYKNALSHPDLQALIGNPFLLKIVLDVLPSLGSKEGSSNRTVYTRTALYEQFAKNWFERSQSRLQGIQLTKEEQKTFNRLAEEDFVEHGIDFSQEFALALYEKQVLVATYSTGKAGEEQEWGAFLSNADEKTRLLRFNAPLSRQGDQYRFIHKSFRDYFVARALWEEFADIKQSAWINKLNLVEDPAVLDFLVEQVQQRGVSIELLIDWIKASKNKAFETAAVNALTILVRARVPLSGINFNGIHARGADLRYGVFDQTQFEGAVLTGSNLQRAWLRQANFLNAERSGVRFGELSALGADEIYIAPQVTTAMNPSARFDLDEVVAAFLKQNELDNSSNVFLLWGGAGSGKSTFSQHLEQRLLRKYIASAASDELPMPFYISLRTIERPCKDLIGQYLVDKYSFSLEQIESFRKSQRFIFILDGYDEISSKQRALFADDSLDRWQAKIIISSRPEYLNEGYQNDFQLRGYSRPLLEYRLAPFSDASIDYYIDQYVGRITSQQSARYYKYVVERSPNLKELLGNPFLLKMALGVLSTLDETKLDQAGKIDLTRIELYEQFMKTWFQRSFARLQVIRLTEEQRQAFHSLIENFVEHNMNFNEGLALEMYEAGKMVMTYSAMARRGVPHNKRYGAFLVNNDGAANLLSLCAPLIRQGDQYRFIHRSIRDYFVARALWEELKGLTEAGSSDVSGNSNVMQDLQALWKEQGDHVELEPLALFNHLNVVEDPAVLSFLVERVRQEQALIKPLLGWVKASKTRDGVERAAANALTILVKAGGQLNGLDLSKIKVPGADLSNGMFDQTQFEEADLSDVKLRGTWLRGANLGKAKLGGVNFGELPSLEVGKKVYCCCYSPNGHWLAVGMGDGEIGLYQTKSLELVRMIKGSSGEVRSVNFSPDGEVLAFGSTDGKVGLWRVGNGEKLHTFEGHSDEVMSASFSPNGEVLALGSTDGKVGLWRVGNGEKLHTFEGHSDEVMSASFSPNGEVLALGSTDGKVGLWRVGNGEKLHTFEGHSDGVWSVSFSPNGKILASGSLDQTVRLWRVESGEELHTLKGHCNWVNSVNFSPNGEVLASGSMDYTVRLWGVYGGEALHTLAGHCSWVSSVNFSPDGKILASGSLDQTVRLWRVESGEELHTLKGHCNWVNSVNFSPNGEVLASGSMDYTVRLWGVYGGEALHTLAGHCSWVSSVNFSPDGKILASGSLDQTVRLWRVDDWKADLYWTSYRKGMTVTNMSIQGAKCLSSMNTRLLAQRGAYGEPTSASSSSSEDADILLSAQLSTLAFQSGTAHNFA